MTGATTGMRPRQRDWVAIVVGLAVIAAVVNWQFLRDARPHAATGRTVPAAAELGRTTSRTIVLPDGEYRVRVTPALDDVATDPALHALQAPDDGSFVGLEITRTDRPAVARWAFRDVSTPRSPIPKQFALVADGRRYPLTRFDAYDREVDEDDTTVYEAPFVAQRVYVAVAGVPDSLQVEAGYAGRTQRVDVRTGERSAGSFAPLYGNRSVSRGCGAATWTGGFGARDDATACTVDLLQRTPYYPGLGWAPAGRVWTLVGVQQRTFPAIEYRAPGRYARYESYGLPKIATRVDGGAAKVSGLYSGVFDRTKRRDVSLFLTTASAARRLEVTATYDAVSKRADSRDDGVPATPDVSVRWTVDLT